MKEKKEYFREILLLALPNIVSNISVPLLNLVDTAIAGHIDSKSLGAIAIATALSHAIFYIWGFLRMATTGLIAQAYGRKDFNAIRKQLYTAIFIAILGGLLVIIFRPLLYKATFLLSSNIDSLSETAVSYLSILFWAAPSTLLLFVLNSFFVGMQNTKIPMFISILSNVINIVLSVIFAIFFDMGINGLALGTVLAQYISVVVAFFIIWRDYHWAFEDFRPNKLINILWLKVYVSMGKNLILRTVMMNAMNLFFVRMGSYYGEDTVAANAILMILFTMFSYFMDGFAYSAEALTGKYIGREDRYSAFTVISMLIKVGLLISLFISLLYFFFADAILSLLSNDMAVLDRAKDFTIYVCIVPIVSYLAFVMDGVFVGATNSARLMNTILLATTCYFISYYALSNSFMADSLWISFLIYLATRSLFQLSIYKRVVNNAFDKSKVIV